ncbi:hypothetical protein [Fischerella thermalis]|uniref:DUF1508 domain-containing protein n=1 Tax=Fischerella thermalis CCMEE 5318 TaxID=2019666 RepID=A0A2N6LBX1_9CYAN|nr:hypothetical protein [Fischerella thermalis]PMB20272.1 hypothetical protein CEN46_16820 [Fischerella thermalis CCMEE 5318]
MKLSDNQSYETDYKTYQIIINKPAKNNYAYWIRGCDIDDSQSGFETAKDAIVAAKNFIDGEENNE